MDVQMRGKRALEIAVWLKSIGPDDSAEGLLLRHELTSLLVRLRRTHSRWKGRQYLVAIERVIYELVQLRGRAGA